jgi:hypothetical protein
LFFRHRRHTPIGILLAECPAAASEAPCKPEEAEDMSTRSSQRWESREQQLRSDWERIYPNTPWNDVRLGYRYGWESAHNPHYAGRTWEAAENDLHAGWDSWQARQADTIGVQFRRRWEELRDSVKRGWEQSMSIEDRG